MSEPTPASAKRPLVDVLTLIVGITVLVLDRLSKYFVTQSLGPDTPHNSVEIIGSFLRFTYVTNTGAAFSLFSDRTEVLALFSLIAAFFMLFGRRLFHLDSLVQRLSLGLVLGGTVGNLIDRAFVGYVIDFIDVGIGNLRWYIFNIADSSLVVGIILLAITILFFSAEEQASHHEVERTGEACDETKGI
jgi:signal peptidase II